MPYTPEHGSPLKLPLWQWTEHMYDGSIPDNFVWAAQWLRCWLIKVQNTGEWRTDVPGGPDELTDTAALAEVLNIAGRRSGLWDVEQGTGELEDAGFDPKVVKSLFEATLSGTVTLYGSMPPAAFHAPFSDLPGPSYYRRKVTDDAPRVDTDSESDDGFDANVLPHAPPVINLANAQVIQVQPGAPPEVVQAVSFTPLPGSPPEPDPDSPSWSPNSPSNASPAYSPPSPP